MMTASLFKHLAVCLIVLLLPISYMRSLLMLPEAIRSTHTWEALFADVEIKPEVVQRLGLLFFVIVSLKKRSGVLMLLLEHFQHV